MRKYVIYSLILTMLTLLSSCGFSKASADGIVVIKRQTDDISESETVFVETSDAIIFDAERPVSPELDAEETTADTVQTVTIVPFETEKTLETTTEIVTEAVTTATAAETTTKLPETIYVAAPTAKPTPTSVASGRYHIIVNMNSMVYHTNPDCTYAKKIAAENRLELDADDFTELDSSGYRQCSYCAKAAQDTTAKQTQAPQTTAPILETTVETTNNSGEKHTYTVIINKNSGAFHIDPNCRHVKSMKEENKLTVSVEDISSLLADGYKPCGTCSKAYKN